MNAIRSGDQLIMWRLISEFIFNICIHLLLWRFDHISSQFEVYY
jgi:hypothetical protein